MERSVKNSGVELGAYVQKLRLETGLSIRGLARAADVDATGISRMEKGDEIPTPHTLASLARVLEVDVSDLLILAGYPVTTELPAFQPYLRARYDLSPEAIEQLGAIFDLVVEHEDRGKEGNHDDDHSHAA
jgi:transcriptional regulator with XRE-family HTH domain